MEAKLAFLTRSDAYPDRPPRVDVIETHLSWVFLTPDRAYKLKKPVTHEFVDLAKLEQREWNCREELRLNRRLAPDVYLAVVPLTFSEAAGLALDGDGGPVDWLVLMKRLPLDATLHERLISGVAVRDDIDRIAARLAVFYRDADRAAIRPGEYVRRFRQHIGHECDRLLVPSLGLPPDRIFALRNRALGFLDGNAEALRRRAEEERIVEAHGDLRPEHVFLLPEPVIIDCLEFNRKLRLLDPVEELAYLALECAHLGAAWVGQALLSAYRAASDDPAPELLVPFYQCCRALLRTRLAIAHLADAVVRDPAKWRRQAFAYLELAERCAERLPARPVD
ncbi:MAG: hypothetical protein L6R19_19675 [Alphaproteobacteria bacterium]|nr:hypothetical protein [Alphaproteobacteria bacterium]